MTDQKTVKSFADVLRTAESSFGGEVDLLALKPDTGDAVVNELRWLERLAHGGRPGDWYGQTPKAECPGHAFVVWHADGRWQRKFNRKGRMKMAWRRTFVIASKRERSKTNAVEFAES